MLVSKRLWPDWKQSSRQTEHQSNVQIKVGRGCGERRNWEVAQSKRISWVGARVSHWDMEKAWEVRGKTISWVWHVGLTFMRGLHVDLSNKLWNTLICYSEKCTAGYSCMKVPTCSQYRKQHGDRGLMGYILKMFNIWNMGGRSCSEDLGVRKKTSRSEEHTLQFESQK